LMAITLAQGEDQPYHDEIRLIAGSFSATC
jgi:hypothetical protein